MCLLGRNGKPFMRVAAGRVDLIREGLQNSQRVERLWAWMLQLSQLVRR